MLTIKKDYSAHAKIIVVPSGGICDWASFHEVFRKLLGFPEFYGNNMNAWVDCMTSLDDAGDGMSVIKLSAGDLLILSLDDAPDFRARRPEQYDALLESTAFVNYRRAELGELPVLALMLSGSFGQ